MIKDKQWKELREKYYTECTDSDIKLMLRAKMTNIKISYAPHDLFEWFKKEIERIELLNLI